MIQWDCPHFLGRSVSFRAVATLFDVAGERSFPSQGLLYTMTPPVIPQIDWDDWESEEL